MFWATVFAVTPYWEPCPEPGVPRMGKREADLAQRCEVCRLDCNCTAKALPIRPPACPVLPGLLFRVHRGTDGSWSREKMRYQDFFVREDGIKIGLVKKEILNFFVRTEDFALWVSKLATTSHV